MKIYLTGQQSFAFATNGDLIEMNSSALNPVLSQESDGIFDYSTQRPNITSTPLSNRRLTITDFKNSIDIVRTNYAADGQDCEATRLPKNPDRRLSDSVASDVDTPETRHRRKSLVRQDGLESSCVNCEKDDKDVELCCCHKKVGPIVGEKLEDAVNQSRMEVAELRDMLSTVLSVRLEPGF